MQCVYEQEGQRVGRHLTSVLDRGALQSRHQSSLVGLLPTAQSGRATRANFMHCVQDSRHFLKVSYSLNRQGPWPRDL